MTTLYELAGNYRALSDKLHDTELPEEVIDDTLEAEGGDLNDKAINVAKAAKNMRADAAKIEEAMQQMQARRTALVKRAEHLEKYLLDNLVVAQVNKIESPWFVISVKQNPEAVFIDDESAIPRDYFKEVPATFKLDKALIKQAIKDGFNVSGCHLERGTRLEIK